jgi:putative heme transporter
MLLFPAVVVAVFFGVLPRIANLTDVWHEIRGLSWRADFLLVLLTALNIVTYWPMLVAAMPGLTLGQAAVVCQSSTAVAMTVPAGGAVAVGVSYAMYSSWGFTAGQVARSAMATFFANMAFKLVLPAVALGLLVAEGNASAGLLTTALLGLGALVFCLVCLTLLFRDERFAMWAGRVSERAASRLRALVRKPPVTGWGAAAAAFRGGMVSLIRERGLALSAAEIVSQLAVFSVMFAGIRLVGITNAQVTFAEALAVFAFVRLASAMPIIPGNVGLAELGYIGGIDLAGAHDVQAVAAVLLFRFLTYFLQIPLGGITYLVWRRKSGWRAPLRSLAHEDYAMQAAGAVREAGDGERNHRLVEQADQGDEQPSRVSPS